MGTGGKPARRLTLELNDVAAAKLESLRALTGAGSDAEVIRKALAVYEFVAGEKKAGRVPAVVEPSTGKVSEIVLI